MNNTPIYALSAQPRGATRMGAVQYGASRGHQSSVSLLPPQYAGDFWDNLTPWDTEDEKEAKLAAAQAEEEAFQQRLAEVGQVAPPTPLSPVMLGIVGLVFAGVIYGISRS